MQIQLYACIDINNRLPTTSMNLYMQNTWQCLILLGIGWIDLVMVQSHYNACYVISTAAGKSSLG